MGLDLRQSLVMAAQVISWKSKVVRRLKQAFRIFANLIVVGLGLIGLAGLPDDLATWQKWIDGIVKDPQVVEVASRAVELSAYVNLWWVSMSAILLPITLTFLFVGGVVIADALSIIEREYSSLLNIALSVISIFLVAFPIFYTIFIFVPVSFTKNLGYIRWNFLTTKIYRGNVKTHPQLSRWLK